MSGRINTGSIVQDKRDKIWRFYWWEKGNRRSKALGRFNTKAAAWAAAKPLRDALESGPEPPAPAIETTIGNIAERFIEERMPTRYDTRRAYLCWIRNYILPQWSKCLITELEPRPVELWLGTLPLSPKSKAHIRGLLRNFWDYAAWSGDVPREQRNPMELVRLRGVSKRAHTPRVLTVTEFRQFVQQLSEPFRTMALLCCCLGLRISECLALKWSDVDWLNGRLLVERGIVAQRVADVKTEESRRRLVIAGELLTALQAWRQRTEFSELGDWVFAAPYHVGRLPWSYPHVWRIYKNAAQAAEIDGMGTHTLRHTFRSWLDSVGTPVGVQQKLMRHSDIRTTMNIYGDAVSEDMTTAHGKIVGLAFNGTEMARDAS